MFKSQLQFLWRLSCRAPPPSSLLIDLLSKTHNCRFKAFGASACDIKHAHLFTFTLHTRSLTATVGLRRHHGGFSPSPFQVWLKIKPSYEDYLWPSTFCLPWINPSSSRWVMTSYKRHCMCVRGSFLCSSAHSQSKIWLWRGGELTLCVSSLWKASSLRSMKVHSCLSFVHSFPVSVSSLSAVFSLDCRDLSFISSLSLLLCAVWCHAA